MEDSLLAESNPSKKKACARFYYEVVAEHTVGGTSYIKPGMQIPFTCNVHERVLLNVGDQADLDEKTVNED